MGAEARLALLRADFLGLNAIDIRGGRAFIQMLYELLDACIITLGLANHLDTASESPHWSVAKKILQSRRTRSGRSPSVQPSEPAFV